MYRTLSSHVSDEHMETEARDSLTASHYGVGIQKQHTISKGNDGHNIKRLAYKDNILLAKVMLDTI